MPFSKEELSEFEAVAIAYKKSRIAASKARTDRALAFYNYAKPTDVYKRLEKLMYEFPILPYYQGERVKMFGVIHDYLAYAENHIKGTPLYSDPAVRKNMLVEFQGWTTYRKQDHGVTPEDMIELTRLGEKFLSECVLFE